MEFIFRCPWYLFLWSWSRSSLGKCIFDEVQRTVMVVSPSISQNKFPQPATVDSENQTEPVVSVPASEGPGGPSTFQIPANFQSSAFQRTAFLRTKRMFGDATQSSERAQPIRIKTWIACESSNLSHREKERMESAVTEAVTVISSLLSVRRVSSRLLLSRDINKFCRFIWRNASAANYNKCGRANEHYRTESCLDVTIPEDHLNECAVYPHPDSPIKKVLRPEGAGLPDTDFLLYLHTQDTDRCRAEPSVLAYAVHCQTDSQGRPLAGVVVICRDWLRKEGYSHERVVQTVIHELLHALGFSKDLFSTWRDCPHSSQTGVGCSLRGQVVNVDETDQMRIYSQSVVQALQNHLNSTHSNLGAPLENLDAGSGRVSSHWEARVLQGSIMAAALVDPSVVRIDPITLAALHDTGWYSVNFSRAQSLVWGEGEGDLFGSLSTCHTRSSFFCTGSGLGCHYLHLHKGECQSDEYLEGCRIYKPLANASECWKEDNKRGSGEEEKSGEIYHVDSRCFFSNLSRENHSLNVSVVGHCYRHRCTGVNRYQILVSGSDWLDCPAGGAIEVPGYHGVVVCPDKRLCLYYDEALPTKNLLFHQSASFSTDTSSNNRDQPLTQKDMTSHPSSTSDPASLSSLWVSSTEVTVSSVSGVAAFVSLLAVLMSIYRKCSSARMRVHAAIEAPSVLELQTPQCFARQFV